MLFILLCNVYSKVYVYYDSIFDFSLNRISILMEFEFTEFVLRLKNEMIGCIYSMKLLNLTLIKS